MSFNIESQKKAARLDILGQCTLAELFTELRKRASQDVEEDEEIYWEDELERLHKDRLSHQFPFK